jgi:hypothetical protein
MFHKARGAVMARNRNWLESVQAYLQDIIESGERISRTEVLPLAVRLYWAGQAVAAGRVLAYMLNDEALSERTIEFWRYAGELVRELNHVEWEWKQAQAGAQAQV